MHFSRVLLLVASVACTKASEPTHSRNEPKPHVAPVVGDAAPAPGPGSGTTVDKDDPCPLRGGPQTTAVQRIGLYGRVHPHELGYVWHSNKHFKVLMDGREIENVPIKDVPKGFIALSKTSWFVQRCDETGCQEHGNGKAIDRIDRKTQQVTKLAGPESEIAFAEAYAQKLYWATFGPYGQTGELRRVPEAGGTVETLWTGSGVHSVLIKDSTVYVADEHTVNAIPIGPVGKKLQLAKDLRDPRGLAVDDKYLYIVDRGDPYWKSKESGFVLRVPIAGGTVEKLAGPIKWPTVVGVDSDRIYFMGDGTGDVWAIPKSGGKAEILIPTPNRDWECRSTKWLNVSDTGLRYLRMSEGFDTGTNRPIDWGTLWSIQRDWMKDPVKQFADYVATHGTGAGSGSGSGSAAGSAAPAER